MRKFLVISIPIVTLVFFIVVMLSGNYLKRPLGKDDNVPESIGIVMENVNKEEWKEAYKNTEQLYDAWNKVIKRVQFSSERDEINALSASIARIKGAVSAQDKASALIELNAAYEHYNGLGR
ncbi:putative Mrr-cat superfamily restriction endonuclease [Clostridium tetanomorphum]|uniref:DUF4363 family protein n=1 Tax=Clostridium tetanomorphum TaxID=1553 RepID=A0A923J2W3_CLOTT|nr:DUF4363 family protein [Clostridium tetanomorphum]KAJ50113.1 hypothetical protein CTM_19759 [Clostridium tetanomorphum DSM 665]MBC2399218.1 DUF4363 family protein [Clostridium tetanomorphum]MBP1862858.1 putative Mrr-cat superfamily restriction endonuclease [Clostridium tetanomorphum]NRS86995.1 putative Mrr-cat superfamily restriction endonuclease [Clostridium tetanomorphum]NRZ99220.1 putative Mrr-cat superfamily restriction endonuclease [Clostridium tetanomorphum]